MAQWKAVEVILRERHTTANDNVEEPAEEEVAAITQKPLEKSPSFNRQESNLSNEVGAVRQKVDVVTIDVGVVSSEIVSPVRCVRRAVSNKAMVQACVHGATIQISWSCFTMLVIKFGRLNTIEEQIDILCAIERKIPVNVVFNVELSSRCRLSYLIKSCLLFLTKNISLLLILFTTGLLLYLSYIFLRYFLLCCITHIQLFVNPRKAHFENCSKRRQYCI